VEDCFNQPRIAVLIERSFSDTVIAEAEAEFDWELENGVRRNSSKKGRRLVRYDIND